MWKLTRLCQNGHFQWQKHPWVVSTRTIIESKVYSYVFRHYPSDPPTTSLHPGSIEQSLRDLDCFLKSWHAVPSANEPCIDRATTRLSCLPRHVTHAVMWCTGSQKFTGCWQGMCAFIDFLWFNKCYEVRSSQSVHGMFIPKRVFPFIADNFTQSVWSVDNVDWCLWLPCHSWASEFLKLKATTDAFLEKMTMV